MEIVLLFGMPKIVEAAGRSNNFYTFVITPESIDATGGGTNYPGAPIDSNIPTTVGGQQVVNWRIQFQNGISAAAPNSTRFVYGWRVVTTKGFRGDTQQRARFMVYAQPLGSTSYTSSEVVAQISPQLTGPEGQYFEFVFDYATGVYELYIDGVYMGKGKMSTADAVWRRDAPVLVNMITDQWTSPYSILEFRGIVKDLYMGKLEPGEVFEPLGTLNVEQLLTQSISYDNGVAFTPTKVDQWNQSSYFALDTAGAAEATSTFQDPTPLKTAMAITMMAPNISMDGANAIAFTAQSGGVKIADRLAFGPDRPSTLSGAFIQIDPSKVGSDLKASFKIAT